MGKARSEFAEAGVPRREAILEAAREAFVAKGFEATSLDEIIARAGGSRRNIYAAFGGKRGLFQAVMARTIDEIVAAFEEPEAAETDVEAWLLHTGRSFARAMLGVQATALFREVIGSARLERETAEMLMGAGPDRLRRRLAGWLRDRTAEGRLDVADPDRAAAILPEMFKGGFQLEIMTGRRDRIPGAEIDAHVAAAVALFLDGARPRRGRSRA